MTELYLSQTFLPFLRRRVDHQKRIAVWQNLLDLVDVVDHALLTRFLLSASPAAVPANPSL